MKFETVRIHFFSYAFGLLSEIFLLWQRDLTTSLYFTHRNSPKFGAGATLLNLNSITLPQCEPQ